MSLRGSNAGRSRRRRASSSVLPPLRWLHGLHAATRFSHVCPPPRWRGMTWSRVRSWDWRPQYWHVWRSRAKTSRRESLTRGRGRRIWYRSRIAEGARQVTDVERFVVLVQNEHDTVHRADDSRTFGTCRGARERCRSAAARG